MFKYKYHIEAFVRTAVIICVFLAGIRIHGMAGNISDWYIDKDILFIAQKSFNCNGAVNIVLVFTIMFCLFELVWAGRYYIRIYILERNSSLRLGLLYRLMWLLTMGISFFVIVKANYILKPYYDAVMKIIDEKDLDTVTELIDSKNTAVLYITREGCKVCDEMTESLLNVLPGIDIPFIHYDTAEDRSERADVMYPLLDRLSVTGVPSIVLLKNGEPLEILDNLKNEAELVSKLAELSEGIKH